MVKKQQVQAQQGRQLIIQRKKMKVYELKEYLTETDKEFFKIMNEMQEKKINRRSSFSRYGCGPELLVYTSD